MNDSGSRMSNADKDRQNLMESLDEKLNEFVGKLNRKPYMEGYTENNWEKEMELHPAFRSEPIKEDEEMPPLIEALQQLKYDPNENSLEELATNYKEDGNYNFRLKKYQWAIQCYSEGLRQNCQNVLLNAQLYTNRAAAQYYLGNYRASTKDCECALALQENHMKAIIRAVLCFVQLGRYMDTIDWCNRGLKINPEDKQLLTLKAEAEQKKKLSERDQRKESAKQKKLRQQDDTLLTTIKERGIRLASESSEMLTMTNLEPLHPSAIHSKVHLDEHGHLVWPVMFMYPEHGQTDFIQHFHETDTFGDQLSQMFGEDAERPQWDTDRKYIPENLEIYFEDVPGNTLWRVGLNKTLSDVLQHPKYIVRGGTPTFLVTVRKTLFEMDFVRKFDVRSA